MQAFDRISTALGEALIAAPAYPLLKSIVQTHIAEGFYASPDVVAASPIESIEGFPLSAAISAGSVVINGQAKVVAVDSLASNGVVHQVDQILNPYTAYFGVSNTTSAPANTTQTGGAIADILLDDERLSMARNILLAVSPDLVNNRFRATGPRGPQILAAPSNDAFKSLPDSTFLSATAPSNQDLSFQLFSWGLLDTSSRFEDLNFSDGDIAIANVYTGINVTVSRTRGGAIFLNNAVVQEQICGSNGCVWLIDRVLDPLYLAFGPTV
jgi:uncharacterized surface protein with fasciclin (FAS1) repeats